MSEDAEIVTRVLKGDAEAFAVLVEKYKGVLLALGYAKSGKKAEAEELAQETFCRAFSSLATLKDPDKLGSWLQGILQRVWGDRFKARNLRTVSFGDGYDTEKKDWEDGTEHLPETAVEKAERQDKVLAAVNSLAPHFRETVILKYMLGYSYAEIAATLGITVDAVDTRLRRAKMTLRKRLKDFGEG